MFHSEYCLVFFSIVGALLSMIWREFQNKKITDMYDKDRIDVV
jgi:hypothetical protein